jgi:hypothetical protein
MSTGRFATPGRTRSCPHCRATILESATVCPGCNHHLRFDPGASQREPAGTPLRVEGTLRHASSSGGAWEYSVVLAIRNDRGEEIARQVVGVGALQPSESRTFTLAVEVFKPAEAREPKAQASESASRAVPDPRAIDPRAPVKPGSTGSGRPEPLRPPGLPAGTPARLGSSPTRPSSAAAPPPAGRAPPSGTAPAQPGPAAQTPKPTASPARPLFSKTPFLGRGK